MNICTFPIIYVVVVFFFRTYLNNINWSLVMTEDLPKVSDK